MSLPIVATLLAALCLACDPSHCGNGIVEAGEICDDGNKNDNDDCPNDCTGCGNGVLDPGEQCDDGNKEDHDDCSSTCKIVLNGPPGAAAPASPSKSRP